MKRSRLIEILNEQGFVGDADMLLDSLLDEIEKTRLSPGDPVRAALEGALQPLFDDAKHDLEQATHAGDGGGVRYAVIRKIALEQAMEALRAAL